MPTLQIPKAAAASQAEIDRAADDTGHIGRSRANATGRIQRPKPQAKQPDSTTDRQASDRDGSSALLMPAATLITGTEDMSFDKTVGMEAIKSQILIGYINRLKSKQLFARSDTPPSILMYGPPGTGKTYVTRAIIGEIARTGTPVVGFQATGSNIGSRYHGETEKNIAMLWGGAQAKAEELATQKGPNATAIIFMDEVEAIAGIRGRSEVKDDSSTATLLQMMDGVNRFTRVRVIAATNLPWQLDSAIVSRFTIKIFVDLPSDKMRLTFLIKEFAAFCDVTDDRMGPLLRDIVHMTGPRQDHVDDPIENANDITEGMWHRQNGRFPHASGVSRHGFSMRDMKSLMDRLLTSLAIIKFIVESDAHEACTYVKGEGSVLQTMLQTAGKRPEEFRAQLQRIQAKTEPCSSTDFASLTYDVDFMIAHLRNVAESAIRLVPSSIRHDEYVQLVAYSITGAEPPRN